MKKQKIFLFIIILLLCLIVLSIIVNQNKNIKRDTAIIKEMSESTQVTDLNNQINALNVSHEQYAKNVQAYKEKIAEAITSQGVSTSAEAKAEVMAENIGKILQAKTTATATAAQILKGQTAWVNGSKITGTMVNRGALNWKPTSSTTKTIAAGYYSGGPLDSSGAYNSGYNKGVAITKDTSSLNSITISNKSSIRVSGWTSYGGYQDCTVKAGDMNIIIAPTGNDIWDVTLSWK